jgi:Na+-translocating ferredoxin:NAD+ oxidoreductase RnfC subunit
VKIYQSCRVAAWVGGLLSSILLVGQSVPLRAQSAPVPSTVSVILPLRGNVAALFVTTGDQVQRGQLMAKLEQSNGQTFYVSAPASGRVTLAALPPERPLPARTVLATVTVAVK